MPESRFVEREWRRKQAGRWQHTVMVSGTRRDIFERGGVTFRVPGFHIVLGSSSNPNRGGVALLVKHYLEKYIQRIDTTVEDQIWLEFSFLPDVIFGGVYIPPADSPYFSLDAFSKLQGKVLPPTSRYILLGDMNSMFGPLVNEVIGKKQREAGWAYDPSPDGVAHPNQNAKHIARVCQSWHLVVLNNLRTAKQVYRGALSFRRGQNWISELDICLITPSLVDNVTSLRFDQSCHRPSNHAPFSLGTNARACRISGILWS